MSPKVKAGLVLLAALAAAPVAAGFCGFYVAQADSKLFNQSSEVVLVRDGNQTVLTMANDYKGDPKQFAVVIPVPTEISKDQIQIVDKGLIDAVDAYSAPRLTEYWDPDPCPPPMDTRYYEYDDMAPMAAMEAKADGPEIDYARAKSLGVKVEATYTVGEYDIVILSAKQSGGLVTWLTENGYKIPDGAEHVLDSYLRQNMHFFLAKVNLEEAAKLGQLGDRPFLRPIQVRFITPKFMLPIRLGMVNADGAQDLLIYTLTHTGRVETTNYRTTKLPTDENVPEYVKDDFGRFYKSMFAQQVEKQGMQTVFTEYAWPLSINCDPCSADPITVDQLASLGVGWVVNQYGYHGQDVYLTRLHVRYDMAHFPEDLVFQETGDSSTWQARYVINHPWMGDTTCPAGREYEKTLANRQTQEVQTLASLTGWNPDDIWSHVPKRAKPPAPPKKKETPAPPPDPGNDWWKGVK